MYWSRTRIRYNHSKSLKMTEYVNLKIEEGIGIIEFFHPQSNSLPGKVLSLLADTISTAGNNDDIKVIILKSGGQKLLVGFPSMNYLQ